MTARDDLKHMLMTGGTAYEPEAEQAITALQHELAEQQRAEMHAPGRSYDASRWNRCVDMIADYIDPEVTG